MLKSLTIEIQNDWRFVRSIKGRIQDELSELPERVRYAAGMTTAELVGNAIKYGAKGSGGPPARLSFVVTSGRIVIAVSNQVLQQEHVREVRTRVDQLAQTANKEALYLQRLQELLQHPSASCQLGLYRIAYEGGFRLDCLYEGTILTIKATRDLA